MKFNCDPINTLPHARMSALKNLNLRAFDVDLEQIDFPGAALVDRLM